MRAHKNKKNRIASSAVALCLFAIAFCGQARAQQPPKAEALKPIAAMKLKKLAPEVKERIYGNRAELQAKYDARLHTAPLAIQQRIAGRNAELAKAGKRFKIGYTSVFDAKLANITGMGRILDPSKLPRPAPAPAPQPSCLEQVAQPTDKTVDMRDYGIVTPVRDQGQCGSCWAFGTTAALETSVLLKNGFGSGVDTSSLNLSEEQLLSCTSEVTRPAGIPINADSCGGGYPFIAAQYVMQHSIVTEAQWPYATQQQSSQCRQHESQHTQFQGRQWGWVCPNGPFPCITPSEVDIKRAIVKYGSVVSAINVDSEFENYEEGIYDNNACENGIWRTGSDGKKTCVSNDTSANSNVLGVPITNHIIQIVGWDDANQAWLIKNSWGSCTGVTSEAYPHQCWGEHGFGWIAYNTNNIGAYAIWIEANQYNNACAAEAAPPSAKLKAAVLHFDNSVQGKDGTEHYWVYVYAGSANDNQIAGFSYSKNDQGGQDYGTGHAAKETFEWTKPISYGDLLKQGGHIRIDFHGTFGGLHFNSDWKTNVALDLIFDDGATRTIHTRTPFNIHVDHNNPSASWSGNFKLDRDEKVQVLGQTIDLGDTFF